MNGKRFDDDGDDDGDGILQSPPSIPTRSDFLLGDEHIKLLLIE